MAEVNYYANSTIQPSRFVISDTTVGKGVNQASGTSSFIVGVSQEWSRLAPLPGATSEAAVQGDPIKVYQVGDVCLLANTSGSGWTAGDRLTSLSDGSGVVASSNQYVGALALTTVSGTNVLGQVQIINGVYT